MNNRVGKEGFIWTLLIQIGAMLAGGVGLAALVGWKTGYFGLATFGSDKYPMAPSAALLFPFYGAALLIFEWKPQNGGAYWCSVALSSISVLASLLIFVLSCLGIHSKAEHLGMPIAGTVHEIPIGFMSPLTALCLVFVGISLLLLLSSPPGRSKRAAAASFSAFIVLCAGMILTIGYSLGAPFLYYSGVIPPSLNVSLAFLIFGAALLASIESRIRRCNQGENDDRIRNRRALILIFVLATTGIIASGYSYYQNYQLTYRSEVESQLTSIVKLKVEQLAQWRKERLGDASIFYRNQVLYELARRFLLNPNDKSADKQLRSWFTKEQIAYQYDRIFLVDTNGDERISIPGSSEPDALLIRQRIPEVLRSEQIELIDFTRNADDESIFLSILIPILSDEDDRPPLGALILDIDPAIFLYPMIQSWPAPSRSDETLLVRRDGDDVLFLNELRYQKNTALTLRIPLNRTDVPAVMAALGKEGIASGNDYRGVKVLSALKAIPDTPWFIIAKIDYEEIFSNWRTISYLLLASIVLFITVATATTGAVWQRNEKAHFRSLAQTQEALTESEVRYRRLFESAKDGILILDAETGFIQDVNPFLLEMLGYSKEQLLGKQLWELGFSEDVSAHRINYEELLRLGYIRYEDLPMQTFDGRQIEVEFVSNVYTVNHQKVIQCNIRDITGRKQAEEILRESELRYRTLANSGQALVWTSGIDKKCDYFNQPWLDFTGRTLEQELGDGWCEGVHPDDLDYCIKIYTHAFDRRDQFSMIYRLRRSDGEYRWIQDNGAPRYNTQGLFLGYIGHCLDITKQKRAEEALERAERTLHAIFNNMKDGILIANIENMRFVFANDAICRMLGYEQQELLNLSVNDIHPLEELPHVLQQFERQVKGDISLASDIIVKRKDGSVFYADINSSIIEIGGQACTIGIFHDITVRKNAQESIQLQSMRIQTLLELHDISNSSPREILDYCLEATIRVSRSQISFIGFINEDESTMTIHAWSENAMEQCALNDRPQSFPVDGGGLWAECIRQRKTVMMNQYDAPHLNKKGCPVGHIPLTRLLCVPVFEGNHIAVVAAVANKNFDYDEGDAAAVSILINKMWEIWRHKQDEEALAESEKRYRQFFEQDLTGNLVSSIDGSLLDCNPACLAIFGYPSLEEAKKINMASHYAHPKEGEDFLRSIREKKQLINVERMRRKLDGKIVYTIENNFGIFNDRGDLIGVRSYIYDNTERKLLEEQFRQVQKMDAVGRLAGGVAHDFNNIIMAIRGYSDLVLRCLPQDHIAHRDIQEIKKAADRAASLTRQLLAFARKETVNPQTLDLNDAVAGILKMIQRLLGEDISLSWNPGENLYRIKIDPSQIDQILVNLAVNARDAIMGVGRITIETSNVVFDNAYCARHIGSIPGEYVLLVVSDDGCGMDKETLSKIFEPFFTTKEMGKGTGLGLPAVFGAVKQNNGFINVYSEPGQGTTFRIYLPRTASGPVRIPLRKEEGTSKGGQETILLVEDDATILNISKRMLAELGYTALAANAPHDAIRLAQEYAKAIHLLITDVVMPEMNGRELASRLAAIKPDMKCLFMSGYTANVIAHRGILEEGVHFIQKPFSEETLAAKIRETLEEKEKPNSTPSS